MTIDDTSIPIPCIKEKKPKERIRAELEHCLRRLTFPRGRNASCKRPTDLQVILHQKNQSRSVYYFTHGRSINPEVLHDVESKKESPYYFTRDNQDFSYRTRCQENLREMREKAKGYNYANRPNHKSRLGKDKLERLFIPESSAALPGRSVAEQIHTDFFRVVEGRPIKERFSKYDYVNDLKKLFLIRMQTGYRYDETYLMEDQHWKEQKRIKEIKEKFQFYAECYEKFLAEDHSSSIVLLKAADSESKKSKMKIEKIRLLHRTCRWYRGKILVLDEQWRIAKIFQKFLYLVSPIWWRNKYDYIHRNADTGEIDLTDTSLFGKDRSGSLTTARSVVTIIDEFLGNVSEAEAPVLYFQNPLELLHIFQELEKSNLLALVQCEEITPPSQQLILGLEKARSHFASEVKILREHLKVLEDEVIFEEKRSLEYEDKVKAISFGFFKNLIVDKYTLNLYVYVEDCYEVCVAPNDSNLSLMMMMKGIEHKQESLMAALDNLPNEIVLKALANCYREDAKIMREAQEATKMITQIENLMNTLRKSLEPKREGKAARKPLRRSEPRKEKMDIIVPSNSLTGEELDFLHFFTDFCPETVDSEIAKEIYAKRDHM